MAARRWRREYGVPYLGALPLNLSIREQADAAGRRWSRTPDSEIAGLYKAVARQVAIAIADQSKDYSSKFPTITVSKTTLSRLPGVGARPRAALESGPFSRCAPLPGWRPAGRSSA